MQLADNCRTRALVLMEIAKEAPELKNQLFAVAQMWLCLSALIENNNISSEQADKSNSVRCRAIREWPLSTLTN
jgi:hypothetical protein